VTAGRQSILSGRGPWVAGLAGAAGAGLLVYLIADIGAASIATQVAGLGTVLPAVLVITGLKYPLQAAGWRLALPPGARPPWAESISATITGDALGYVTWAGPFTGEPIRALLIRRSTPLVAGIAAGAAERGLYNLTAFGLVLVAAVMLTADEQGLIAWIVASLGIASVVGIVMRRRRHRRGKSEADAMGNRPASAQSGRAALLEALAMLWTHRRGALPAIAALCLVQHGLLVLEAYLLLGVLSGEVTFQTALYFEAVTKLVNTVGVVVPGRIGISEGGSALLADVLGLSASYGLSLALMRRVRALIWTGIGLTLLPFQEARARSSG